MVPYFIGQGLYAIYQKSRSGFGRYGKAGAVSWLESTFGRWPMQNARWHHIFERCKVMKLWTWQHREVNLADASQTLKNLDNSSYVATNGQPHEAGMKHKRAYELVFERLGTDQFIWCYDDYGEATSTLSTKEYEPRECCLWELDVPQGQIQWYCMAAWTALREGMPKLPKGLWDIYASLKYLRPQAAERFKEEFEDFWRVKETGGLLDYMFLDRRVDTCSGPLVFHPVDARFITKDPRQIGTWWDCQQPKSGHGVCGGGEEAPQVPCGSCPGRDACR